MLRLLSVIQLIGIISTNVAIIIFTSCCHNQSSYSVSLLFQPPFMSWVDIDSKCGGTEKKAKTWSESSASQDKAEDEDDRNVLHDMYNVQIKDGLCVKAIS